MKDINLKISIIIVTYNRKEYLKRAINSILKQTYTNFELVIVNNGSTDDTNKICEEYAKRDSRISLINIQENRGASRGRNVALDYANGEYITIVDDDDYCENIMVEYLVDLAQEYSADISMCGSYNDFQDRLEEYFVFNETIKLNKLEGLDELLKREKYNVAPPTKLIKKSLFEGIRFPENVLVDDIHVMYKVFAKANIIVAKGKPLYYFTKHENNMTSFIHSNNLTPELLEEYLEMYKQRSKFLISKVPEIKERAIYSEWAYMISMCEKVKRNKLENCTKQYNKMIKVLKERYNDIINCKLILSDDINKLHNIIDENV